MSGDAIDDPALTDLAEEIRKSGKRAIAEIVNIGRCLMEAKKICGHGHWKSWLDKEFGWSDDTALNYMRVYSMCKSRTVRDFSLPLRALYLLSAPSISPKARDEVFERLDRGEQLTTAEVARFVKPLPSQPAEPKEVTLATKRAEWPPSHEQPSRASIVARQLGSCLHSIESLVTCDVFDEAAQILVETKGFEGFSRAQFKKVGAALSYVGNTISGSPAKTAAALVADKYVKPKPH